MSGKNVLIVEDEALIALLIEEAVESAGHQIAAVADRVDAALEYLAHSTPDFALLDVHLGGEMVFPVAAELRKRRIDFILLSGSRADRVVFPAQFAKAPLIEKPFVVSELKALLLTRLGHAD